MPAAPAFVRGLAPVTAGVLTAGLLTFGFLSLAGRVLGPEGLAPVSSLWAMVFIVGPGVFLPLQQEVARVLGGQRAHAGGATAVRRAVVLATALVLVLSAATVALGPWLVPAFFDGQWALLGCFVGAVAAYAVAYTARGVLSGVGAYPELGSMIALESLVRLVLAGGFALAGLRSATWFGVSLAAAPVLSTGLTWWASRGRVPLLPGAPVPWRSLTRAFGWLVLAAVLMQLLANVGPLAVEVLETEGEKGRAGLYLGALMIARVSLYLFQAVQATILPNLAELAAAGRVDEIRHALRRIVAVALGLVVVTFVGGWLLGPFGVRLLFGDEFAIGRWTMAVLASASAVYVLAAALNGAALSIGGHRLSAAAWAVGCVVLAAGFAVPADLFTTVNTAYALGSCAAAAVFLLRLPRALEHLPPGGAQSWSGSSAS